MNHIEVCNVQVVQRPLSTLESCLRNVLVVAEEQGTVKRAQRSLSKLSTLFKYLVVAEEQVGEQRVLYKEYRGR